MSVFSDWLVNTNSVLFVILGGALLLFGLFLVVDFVLVRWHKRPKPKVDSATQRIKYWEGVANDPKAPTELRAQARRLAKPQNPK